MPCIFTLTNIRKRVSDNKMYRAREMTVWGSLWCVLYRKKRVVWRYGAAISQETQFSSLEIFFMSRRRSEMVCRVTPNCFANCFCVWLNSQPVVPPKRGLSIKLQSPLWTKTHTYRMMQYLRWESDKSIRLYFYYIFLVAIHEEYSDGYALCAYAIIDFYELIIFSGLSCNSGKQNVLFSSNVSTMQTPKGWRIISFYYQFLKPWKDIGLFVCLASTSPIWWNNDIIIKKRFFCILYWNLYNARIQASFLSIL